MYNFENEIENVRSRKLRYFFGCDYFHDGIIHSIKKENEEVEMVISTENKAEQYICKFKKCSYFLCESDGEENVFLNSRFKDSGKKNGIQKKTKMNKYHLRMQIIDGCIDIIFSEFEIFDSNGMVPKIPKKVSSIITYKNMISRFQNEKPDVLLEVLEKGEFFHKAMVLQYFGSINNEIALPYARKLLYEEDTKVESVWIIGIMGNESDLTELLKIYVDANIMLKRHIQDAIEKVMYRNL